MTAVGPRACDGCAFFCRHSPARAEVQHLKARPECGEAAITQTVQHASEGTCRISPPRLVRAEHGRHQVTRWPVVRGTHWCGRFKPRVETLL